MRNYERLHRWKNRLSLNDERRVQEAIGDIAELSVYDAFQAACKSEQSVPLVRTILNAGVKAGDIAEKDVKRDGEKVIFVGKIPQRPIPVYQAAVDPASGADCTCVTQIPESIRVEIVTEPPAPPPPASALPVDPATVALADAPGRKGSREPKVVRRVPRPGVVAQRKKPQAVKPPRNDTIRKRK